MIRSVSSRLVFRLAALHQRAKTTKPREPCSVSRTVQLRDRRHDRVTNRSAGGGVTARLDLMLCTDTHVQMWGPQCAQIWTVGDGLQGVVLALTHPPVLHLLPSQLVEMECEWIGPRVERSLTACVSNMAQHSHVCFFLHVHNFF